MNVAEKIEAELGAVPPPKPRSARRVPSGGPDVFALANGVDTVLLLERLGITYTETPRGVMATCPGCNGEGAKVGDHGGLKCLHDRCAHDGPEAHPGFRTNVDLVSLTENRSALESANLICDWFGVSIPHSTNERTRPDSDHEPQRVGTNSRQNRRVPLVR